MAPRSRKVGLRRIDAAVDALRPLGFSTDVIRKTVDALLKVYEGNDGWVFIEEASYKLLIEAILEKQEAAEKADICRSEDREIEKTDCFLAESANKIIEAAETSTSPRVTGAKSDIDSCKDISSKEGLSIEPGPREEHIGARAMICESKSVAMQSQETPPHRRRKPCFGWISDDDDGTDEYNDDWDMMPLTTFRNADEMKCIGQVEFNRNRRRSRWDARPNFI